MDDGRRARFAALVGAVSRRQKLRMTAAGASGPEEEGHEVPDYERVLPPISQARAKFLAGLHGLSVEQVHEWGYYRVILNAYGWLGRRVGDAAVPEDGLVFGVWTGEELSGCNPLGFCGRAGMVVLRATFLVDKFGPEWARRFPLAERAWIADCKEDFDRLMRGLGERPEEEGVDTEAGSA